MTTTLNDILVIGCLTGVGSLLGSQLGTVGSVGGGVLGFFAALNTNRMKTKCQDNDKPTN